MSNRLRRPEKRTAKQMTEQSLPSQSLPTLTLIISAYNEQSVIERKLRNVSLLHYPSELLDVIVVSDGSTDSTNAIVERYSAHTDSRVRLLTMEQQSGKTAGLNHAVPAARGTILIFSDANAMYADDALRRLVEPFSDPTVGYTVGSALYHDEHDGAVNISEGLYWKYELWVKKLESDYFSVVGGDGAIYAIRRELYRPLDKIDISDFVNPLQIVADGFRGIFLPAARSYESGTEAFVDEFRRKRRIVNRSWGAVRRHIGLFSLRNDLRFLFMLISHKAIRWWSCVFVLIAFATACLMAYVQSGGLYFWLAVLIAGSVAVAGIGWAADVREHPMPKFVYLFYYFYLVGVASLLGILDDLRGRRHTIWRHVR
ncbi:glycosyltransferase family 2 protein [Granulosicoccus sp.]|nr:glycosyltransferase family 2 protein [Granulosicoccus sp.]